MQAYGEFESHRFRQFLTGDVAPRSSGERRGLESPHSQAASLARDDDMESRSFVLSPTAALAAVAGVLASQALPVLPSMTVSVVLGALALVLFTQRLGVLPAITIAAFAYGCLHGQWAFDRRLPVGLEGRDFDLVGRVEDLPSRGDGSSRFVMAIESVRDAGTPLPLHGSVRLSWYGSDDPGVRACSRWQLRVRLKRPRGLVNPAGFDAERHALERGIVAVGYVRDAGSARQLEPPRWCIDRWREKVSAGIARQVDDPHDAALLQALAVGDTRGLRPTDWDVARANGVTHLLSISGFHVGVAALFGAWLLRLAWWLRPSVGLRWPRPSAEAVAALLAAIAYGALAGNSLPTLRTVLMIAVFALSRLSRRCGSGAQSLALAALALLLVDPLSVLGSGFWLSFMGVAFLMLGLQRPRSLLAHVRALGHAQLVMTLALLPLGLWFFGQASLLGIVSNLIAVPLVSLAIVPLSLLSALLLLVVEPLAVAPLWVASLLTHVQWNLWAAMAGWPGAQWPRPLVGPLALSLATLGALWLCLPRGMPSRWLGLLLFLPLLWPSLRQPPQGGFDVVFIDVGQGLSVLVRTRHHALLYDAGARFPSGFDLGTAAVLPSLHGIGVQRLDTVVVSHAHNDHAGGMAAVLKQWPNAERYGGEAAGDELAVVPCRDGQRWNWDGVVIRVLRPVEQSAAGSDSNDRSCIVLVEGQGGRLLLGGDISSPIEAALVKRIDIDDARPLVLSVAHHGSRRSSSAAFLRQLKPTLGVVSAAWLSRFGHPHPLVVQRFKDAGIPLLNTADHGALTVQVAADGALEVIRERERRATYWRE